MRQGNALVRNIVATSLNVREVNEHEWFTTKLTEHAEVLGYVKRFLPKLGTKKKNQSTIG